MWCLNHIPIVVSHPWASDSSSGMQLLLLLCFQPQAAVEHMKSRNRITVDQGRHHCLPWSIFVNCHATKPRIIITICPSVEPICKFYIWDFEVSHLGVEVVPCDQRTRYQSTECGKAPSWPTPPPAHDSSGPSSAHVPRLGSGSPCRHGRHRLICMCQVATRPDHSGQIRRQ